MENILANPTHRVRATKWTRSGSLDGDEKERLAAAILAQHPQTHPNHTPIVSLASLDRIGTSSDDEDSLPAVDSAASCETGSTIEPAQIPRRSESAAATVRFPLAVSLPDQTAAGAESAISASPSYADGEDDDAGFAQETLMPLEAEADEPVAVLRPYEYIGNRDPRFYPPSDDLPCHFSFVDNECMIAGMSAPFERRHWATMRRFGIGLVVNLTEQPVTPAAVSSAPAPEGKDAPPVALRVCGVCQEVDEQYEPDIFRDMPSGSEADAAPMQVLFLPIRDGSIPRYEQVEHFMEHAIRTIRSGRRVAVHCQAGIGRTGTFLAAFLMYYYRLTPGQALQHLRFLRPQSLQFNRYDWQTAPFHHYDPDVYQRNLLQEQYVVKYYCDRIMGRPVRAAWTRSAVAAAAEKAQPKRKDSRMDNDADPGTPAECAPATYDIASPSESFLQLDDQLQELVDIEMAKRLADFDTMDAALAAAEHSGASLDEAACDAASRFTATDCNAHADSSDAAEKSTGHTCFVCRGVIAVGPSAVSCHSAWPPAAVPLRYAHERL